MAENFRARVNDTFEFDLTQADLSDLDLVKTGENSWHLLRNNIPENITIERSEFHNASYTIRIDHEKFRVDLQTPLDLFIEDMGFAAAADDAVDKVVSPMPGLLLDICVKEGDTVEIDQPLLVLEAMKMENVILSPRKGTVAAILETKGSSVEKGTDLISFK